MTKAPPTPPLIVRLKRSQQGPLASLLARVEQLNQLQAVLDPLLPPAARPFCRIASYRQGALLLILPNAQWATRLRYQENRLLGLMGQQPAFADIQRILVKVRPPQGPQPGPAQTRTLSLATRESLASAAASMDDQALREALQRLASHGPTTPRR